MRGERLTNPSIPTDDSGGNRLQRRFELAVAIGCVSCGRIIPGEPDPGACLVVHHENGVSLAYCHRCYRFSPMVKRDPDVSVDDIDSLGDCG